MYIKKNVAFLAAVTTFLLSPLTAFGQENFTFTANVSSSSSPIANAEVFISSDDPEGFFNQGVTDASGNVSIITELPDLNEPFNLLISVFPSDLTSVDFPPVDQVIPVEVNQAAASTDITVGIKDRTLTINITDSNDVSRPVQPGEFMSIGCTGENGDIDFIDLQEGDDQGTVSAASGSAYECYLIADGVGSDTAEIPVDSDIGTIKLIEADKELLIKVIDSSGSPISGLDFQVAAIGAGDIDFAGFSSDVNAEGYYSIFVPNTLLDLHYSVISSPEDEEASDYLLITDTVQLESVNDQDKITLEIPVSDATVNVTVTNSAGAPLANTEVAFISFNPEDEFGEISQVKVSDSEGKVSFKAISGREASISAITEGGFRDPEGDGKFNESEPAPKDILVVAGVNNVTLSQIVNDYSLKVSAIAEGVTLERVSCSASNIEVITPIITLVENDVLDIKSSTDPYFVFCDAISSGDNSKIYFGAAEFIADAPGTGEVVVTLEEGGDYFEPQSKLLAGNINTEVGLDDNDCGKFSIPANAAGTGKIEVSVASAVGVRTDKDISLINAINITARNISDNGAEITDLNSDSEIIICYDENALPEGVTEDDLGCAAQPKGIDDVKEVECTVDKEKNLVKIMTDHLSVFGLSAKVKATAAQPKPVPTEVPTTVPTVAPTPVPPVVPTVVPPVATVPPVAPVPTAIPVPTTPADTAADIQGIVELLNQFPKDPSEDRTELQSSINSGVDRLNAVLANGTVTGKKQKKAVKKAIKALKKTGRITKGKKKAKKKYKKFLRIAKKLSKKALKLVNKLV